MWSGNMVSRVLPGTRLDTTRRPAPTRSGSAVESVGVPHDDNLARRVRAVPSNGAGDMCAMPANVRVRRIAQAGETRRRHHAVASLSEINIGGDARVEHRVGDAAACSALPPDAVGIGFLGIP